MVRSNAGLSFQERYMDIAIRSGLGPDIIRRVLGAAQESLMESLEMGQRATLPGICSIKPAIRCVIDDLGNIVGSGFVKIEPSGNIKSHMAEIREFKKETDTSSGEGFKVREVML